MVVALVVVTSTLSLEFTMCATRLFATESVVTQIVPRLVQSFRSSVSEASRSLVIVSVSGDGEIPLLAVCCTRCFLMIKTARGNDAGPISAEPDKLGRRGILELDE
jgi:hypothetical protein